jgi:NADH dehydrogenase
MLVSLTGSTGFVGRHIVDLLFTRGHRVRVLARGSRVLPFAHPERIEKVAGDLSDAAALRTLVTGADAVIHLVGIIVEHGAQTFDAVHVEGTRAVAAAAQAAGCRRFLHMSAVGARDETGATAYHRTKARAESVVRESGLSAVVFRPSFIVGPGNVPVATLARLHRLFPVVPVFGDGRFPTQPVWVGDVALAFALAAERAELTGTFELGGPEVMTYEDFVRAIGRAAGHPRPVVHVPLGLVRAAALGFDPLGPWAPITSDQLQMLVEGTVTPENAIERVFGIRPAPLAEALKFLSGPKARA